MYLVHIYIVHIIRKMSNSNSISPLESSIPNSTNGLFTATNNGDRSHSPDNDRNLSVTLDDRGNLTQIFGFSVFFTFIICVFPQYLNDEKLLLGKILRFVDAFSKSDQRNDRH